jgi:hypothetical protein
MISKLEHARGLTTTPSSTMEICAMEWKSTSTIDLPPDGDLRSRLIAECEIAPSLIFLWTSTIVPVR